MSLTLKVDNRRLVVARVRAALALAGSDLAEHLLEESNRTAPIEEEILIGSGVADFDPASLRGAVSYDTAYAVRQHEDMTYSHDPGRRAKWLEATFKERGPAGIAYIAAKLKAVG